MKNEAAIVWGKSNESIRAVSKPPATSKTGVSQVMDHLILYVTLICAWGRFGSAANSPRISQGLIRAAMSQLNLSARAYHRTQTVKLARTVVDLAGCEAIPAVHVAALPVCFAKALHASRRPKLMLS